MKINILLDELGENPVIGSGKPEKLRHYKSPTWSRRITDKHRLEYRIEEEKVIILVLSFWDTTATNRENIPLTKIIN